MSSVSILDPHDVIFACVGTDLNFDDFERDFARIGEAMDFSERDIGAFVFVQNEDFIADGNLGRTGYNNPMFRAMKMLLQ